MFANVRHRLTPHLQLRAEVSGLAAHSLRLPDAEGEPERYTITPGVQVMAGLNVFFGGSTLERLMEDVLK